MYSIIYMSCNNEGKERVIDTVHVYVYLYVHVCVYLYVHVHVYICTCTLQMENVYKALCDQKLTLTAVF